MPRTEQDLMPGSNPDFPQAAARSWKDSHYPKVDFDPILVSS
jgi:hypothetical protein